MMLWKLMSRRVEVFGRIYIKQIIFSDIEKRKIHTHTIPLMVLILTSMATTMTTIMTTDVREIFARRVMFLKITPNLCVYVRDVL